MQMKGLQGLYHQSPKLNQLNILKEIDAKATITQAELASRCSLSGAMVNNYMKELCETGLLEYRRKSIKTVSYYLTPLGEQKLELLHSEFINELVNRYIAAKDQIYKRISSQANSELRRVILFGRGHLAQLVLHALESSGVNILGICDDNMETMGDGFCGREIINSSQIRFLSPDAVIIADAERTEEIYSNIAYLPGIGIQIICLDEAWRTKPVQNAYHDDYVPSLSKTIEQDYPDASQTVRN
jgi:DNA-binding MarR family transcriptional regulator